MSRLARELEDLLSTSRQHENRIGILERELAADAEGMKNAPTDPGKRQKYLERRLVLSERNILKLTHDVELVRLEKRRNVDALE